MSDNKTQFAQDQKLIALVEDYEVRYWTNSLNCTVEELRSAVSVVGNSAEAVRRHLAVPKK
ncbi:MAG: DUF3606 domain-containing protein [Acidovorax sp.]|uniref:DUF3606 domain-containing protein n=1 Tax=Acidovorax sp. TaxID=1872122 RepID=UPI00391A736C